MANAPTHPDNRESGNSLPMFLSEPEYTAEERALLDEPFPPNWADISTEYFRNCELCSDYHPSTGPSEQIYRCARPACRALYHHECLQEMLTKLTEQDSLLMPMECLRCGTGWDLDSDFEEPEHRRKLWCIGELRQKTIQLLRQLRQLRQELRQGRLKKKRLQQELLCQKQLQQQTRNHPQIQQQYCQPQPRQQMQVLSLQDQPPQNQQPEQYCQSQPQQQIQVLPRQCQSSQHPEQINQQMQHQQQVQVHPLQDRPPQHQGQNQQQLQAYPLRCQLPQHQQQQIQLHLQQYYPAQQIYQQLHQQQPQPLRQYQSLQQMQPQHQLQTQLKPYQARYQQLQMQYELRMLQQHQRPAQHPIQMQQQLQRQHNPQLHQQLHPPHQQQPPTKPKPHRTAPEMARSAKKPRRNRPDPPRGRTIIPMSFAVIGDRFHCTFVEDGVPCRLHYGSADSLRRHHRTIHDDSLPCPDCHSGWSTVAKLSRHLAEVHGVAPVRRVTPSHGAAPLHGATPVPQTPLRRLAPKQRRQDTVPRDWSRKQKHDDFA
ncbi:hypothetical protein BO99DRAFT_431629 [Aspergillus violaceofuscus CBS 115571]|uniref:C2H2-type domain-containing protein n=1 Tax=Aspergillus violaceofuscus (strain CBS 115571) TaxID=1450538 RepID=A0A2V5HDF6_ASPV1|nr:hypothetical protein BO99DRAFT_431629 [Aspergillus violaceofuscus CBS 115571]